MIQHLLLLMVAPPLIWLGALSFRCLRGLPRPVRVDWIGPLLQARGLRRFVQRLTHPLAALPLFAGTVWLWHAPVPYDWALRSDACHYLEHASFLGAGLLFWFPVVRPAPSRPTWSPWLLVPYLILADVQNTVLSALLTFSDRPLYAYYTEAPALAGFSPLRDQAAAGVLMWVPGSIAYLAPLFAIGVQLLFTSPVKHRALWRNREQARPRSRPILEPARSRLQLPVLQERPVPVGFDLLETPFVGRFLKWKHAGLPCNSR